MVIQELPFFVILLLTILPIVIGILIFTRVVSIAMDLVRRYRKEKESITLMDFGDLYLFLIFFTVIVAIVYYVLGTQPSGFSIFDFLINDMLPIGWYSILLYGILAHMTMMFGGETDG